jgi:hypothetical protein
MTSVTYSKHSKYSESGYQRSSEDIEGFEDETGPAKA